MSRAFVKDDAPGAPPIVPPRAPLPAGVPNYVTPRGLALLREEQAALQTERQRLGAENADDSDQQRARMVVGQRLADLAERLATAQQVSPDKQDPDTVRFGATVTVQTDATAERRFQIVGVDEADASEDRIAFVAPMARVVTGKRVGETATLRTPQGEKTVTVTAIDYDSD